MSNRRNRFPQLFQCYSLFQLCIYHMYFDLSVLFLFFLFVSDIEDLPPAVQEKLFDEVLDRDVQKGKIFT